mmetsp:Transcript_1039/g.1226  ORF Transcript_1039/g.1226 Transcript_1039/m.1226 type:complete len:119 (+) Transcript_1039:3-359(+)
MGTERLRVHTEVLQFQLTVNISAVITARASFRVDDYKASVLQNARTVCLSGYRHHDAAVRRTNLVQTTDFGTHRQGGGKRRPLPMLRRPHGPFNAGYVTGVGQNLPQRIFQALQMDAR